MTEINIILDTHIENTEEIIKNDKEIFYEKLNEELNLYKYNSYNNYKLDYNQIKEDFLYNDNYIDYENEILNLNIDIKKILFKKLLIFYNPIITQKESGTNTILKIFDIKKYETNNTIKKKNLIVNVNNISLNYPIEIKYLTKSKLIDRIINTNYNFEIGGLYLKKSKYRNNLNYKLNNYKFTELFNYNAINKLFNENIEIYYKSKNIKFESKKDNNLLNIKNIENDELKELYILYLNSINSYSNNLFLQNTKKYKEILKSIDYYKEIKTNPELVDKKYYKNYILEFNKFLNYKIENGFNNHSYYSFDADNLLNLYENILIKSIDEQNIKDKIEKIIEKQKNKKQYKKDKKIIDKYNLKLIQLELLTKKKFPNLFNANSKEYLFTKYKKFNLEDLPKKYKDIILIEYNKLQNYIEESNKNKCKHKGLISKLFLENNKYPILEQITKLINTKNEESEYYKCIICSYNLICPHVVEYYNLLFDKKKNKDTIEFSIRQHILNKYMTDAKVNMIYYCKICGEELGKSLDLEQNIQYQDNKKLNVSEYNDETMDLVKKNISNIIFSYITFTEFNLNLSKTYLINYVNEKILFYINNLEKNLRKSKIYNEEKIINILSFNTIIFTYATLIFIMSKYTFIIFTNAFKKTKKGSNIITHRIQGGKKNNSIIIKKQNILDIIKNRFKEAYDIIITSNNILLSQLDYLKNSEKIKELLIKSYGIIAKSDQIIINEKSKSLISNKNLVLTSNIYKYYYLISNLYNHYNKNLKINSKSSIFNNEYIYKNDNIKFQISNINDINPEDILNTKLTNNKENKNIFNNFKSSILLNEKDFINYYEKFPKDMKYNDYKILSFNLFYNHIQNEFYNIPIYNIINQNKNKKNQPPKIFDNINNDEYYQIDNKSDYYKYYQYLNICSKLKEYEIQLINKNLIYNLYPYSIIKLNNLRYYYPKNINLNIYFCTKDGFPHKYNNYIYNLNKKEIIINKNKIDDFISNNKEKDIIKFIDYQCIKCLQYKNKITELSKYDNNKINILLNEINDINGFFNLYLNVCPITNKSNEFQFHIFKEDNEKKDRICTICKIQYSDLIQKNKEIYDKYNKEYNDYKNKKLENINKELEIYTNNKTKLEKINISSYILGHTSNEIFINNINKLILDNLVVKISKKFNIQIIYLQKLGLTESFKYDEIKDIHVNYDNIDNRLNKLINYLRLCYIYLNILKNNKKVQYYFDNEFNELLDKYKDISINLNKYIPNYEFNLSNIFLIVKLNKNNKEIIDFYLKSIFNFILAIDELNESKFNKKLDSFIKFIIQKILKYDELFTNYNYSQLKQMFTENNYINSNTYEEVIENEDDDDNLFAYNDLNINFEDEDNDD